MKKLILAASMTFLSLAAQAHALQELSPTEARISDCYSKDREDYINLRFHSQFFMQSDFLDSQEARKFLHCQIKKENFAFHKQNPQMSSEEILSLFADSISKDLSELAKVFESTFK